MPNTTFDRPDLSAFTRLDDLGLEVTGQRMWPDHAVLACRIAGEDRWCRRCGCQGEARDTVIRRPAHEPYGWRPTILHVSVRRYRCQGCSHVWRQDMSQAADPRAKLSRAAVRWALTGLVVHHLTVARIAQALGVSWNTANTAVLGEGQRLLINDPTRFEGVRVIGVDEHVWRHTPYGDKYVTVILDLTPIRDRRGPSRLLDMVPGRSKKVFKTWLASQPHTWRERIEIVAMDGCCVPCIVESVLGRIGGLGCLVSVSIRWSCVSVRRVWRWRLVLIPSGVGVLLSALAASWGSILRRCVPGCAPWSRAGAMSVARSVIKRTVSGRWKLKTVNCAEPMRS